jgi:hypothetical protein
LATSYDGRNARFTYSGTWDLVPAPQGKSIVGCRWIFTIKVGLDGTVDHLKAQLVAKGYTQIFGLDYGDTFSTIAKMTSVPFAIGLFLTMAAIRHSPFAISLFLTMDAIRHWPLYQLDMKNTFLHNDLAE